MSLDRNSGYDQAPIDFNTVSNPEDLQDVLRCITRVLDSLRVTVNELVVDHSTQVMYNSNLRSAVVEVVTDLSGLVDTFSDMYSVVGGLGSNFESAMTTLQTDAKLSSVSNVTCACGLSMTAGPAVLTASTTTAGPAALTESSVVADTTNAAYLYGAGISGGTPQ